MSVAAKLLTLLGRVVLAVATLVFLVIAVGVLLVLLGGNPSNSLVRAATGAAEFLAGPFNGLFTFDDREVETGINWGIAAFAWLIVGAIVAGLLRALGRRGRRGRR